MLRAMAKQPTISFIGAGSLASGMAGRLNAAGYRIDEVIVRNSRASLARGRRLAKESRRALRDISQCPVRSGRDLVRRLR